MSAENSSMFPGEDGAPLPASHPQFAPTMFKRYDDEPMVLTGPGLSDVSDVPLGWAPAPRHIPSFEEFVRWVSTRWSAQDSDRNLAIAALGLAGETGEVIEHFKKHIRDGKPLDGNIELIYELGDVLHYWLRLCELANADPLVVMAYNVEKLKARDAAKGTL